MITNILPAHLSLSFVFGFFCLQPLAATIEQSGGSNFVAIVPNIYQLKLGDSWKDSNTFRTPACQYDSQAAPVDRELQAMRQSGQKKLALVLWFRHMERMDDCAGFMLNSAAGHFSSRILGNLTHLVERARALGFDEVQIRFAPMLGNKPQKWAAWNQSMFDENWSVIDSTIMALSRAHGPHVIYDLDLELGGIVCKKNDGLCELYVQRLWAAYTKKYSVGDSYGFSIAIAPGRVGQLLHDLRLAGPLPNEIAIDTYHSDDPGINWVAQEMRQQGVELPILVQETSYDDPAMYEAILQQARDNHLQVRAIMQWPLRSGQKARMSESETPAFIYKPAP